MRQRKAKDLDKRLSACSEYLIDDKSDIEAFCGRDEDKGIELFLEIGCGKGNFIIKKALENPDKKYIAVEGQETVILRALEKAMELDLSNLKFMMKFVQNMDEFFEEGSLAGIYLNFSDPWPKARHAKRRLTYSGRLKDYAWALKSDGFIEFKTDNDALYEFSVEEMKSLPEIYDIVEQTDDLHSSEYESRYTTTEYEEKFKALGKNINYIRIEKKDLLG